MGVPRQARSFCAAPGSATFPPTVTQRASATRAPLALGGGVEAGLEHRHQVGGRRGLLRRRGVRLLAAALLRDDPLQPLAVTVAVLRVVEVARQPVDKVLVASASSSLATDRRRWAQSATRGGARRRSTSARARADRPGPADIRAARGRGTRTSRWRRDRHPPSRGAAADRPCRPPRPRPGSRSART